MKEYKLIQSYEAESLQEQINEYVKIGYRVKGGITVYNEKLTVLLFKKD